MLGNAETLRRVAEWNRARAADAERTAGNSVTKFATKKRADAIRYRSNAIEVETVMAEMLAWRAA